MKSLLNRHGVKALALRRAQALRPTWNPTRVSDTFLDSLETAVMQAVDARIKQAPSLGKTLK